MRYFEIISGLRVPVSQEEQKLLNLIGKKRSKEDLDERQQEVARKMVSRGILNRHKEGDRIFYTPNDNSDLWRF